MTARRRLVPLALVTIWLAPACTGGQPVLPPSPAPTAPKSVLGHGVFRAAVEDFQFTDGFDPTGETSPLGMALQSQLLLRTLVTYRHIAGAAGLTPVPDLAKDLGQVSRDGRTWVFHLKPNVRFGPPLDRPVYASDVEYAFRRIESMGIRSTNLYGSVLSGVAPASGVEGISTPNGSTIVFHLVEPLGDFLHRLALPAFAPMPQEVAGCFPQPGAYGRDLVSTGPYMIEGADLVDPSSCRSLEPMRGFRPTRSLHLVRNPHYDPSTDDVAVRESYPDAFEIQIETNTDKIGSDIAEGRLDASIGPILYPAAFSYPGRVMWHWGHLNALEYLAMNVLVPPFDDVHVRRAVNLALDRNAILAAFGPTAHGPPAADLLPPSLTADSRRFLPVTGDLAAARQEMARSRHDADADGRCDASGCAQVLYIGPTTPPEVNALPVLKQELAAIGIHLEVRELDCMCPGPFQPVVKNLVPVSLNRQLRPLYPDPAAIFASLHSSGIACSDQINYSEVGMTSELADRCKVGEAYRRVAAHVPNLDADIERCVTTSGADRATCWMQLDEEVMANVMPWVPIRFPDTLVVAGRTLARFEFDQAFGVISLCHIAVAGSAG